MITKISQLTPDLRNANRGSERGNAVIEQSLRSYGAGRSILIDKNGMIIAGNKTCENAGAIGLDDVIVVESDGKKLVAVQRTDLDLTTDSIAKELALADNRAAELNLDWDAEVLAELGKEVDLSHLWSETELKKLLGENYNGTEAPEPQLDKAEELRAKWDTKLGQLWLIGEHRLLCGDSYDRAQVKKLLNESKADLVFTDPPYGISYKSPSGAGMTQRGNYDVIAGDDKPFDTSCLFGWADTIVAWGANHYADRLPPSAAWLVWDKREGDAINNNSDCELAWVSSGGSARLFHHKWNGMIKASERDEKRGHPTQKPAALAEWSFSVLLAGRRVLDLFGGSGSTLIACEHTGRINYTMEIAPEYVAVTLERLNAMGLTPRLAE